MNNPRPYVDFKLVNVASPEHLVLALRPPGPFRIGRRPGHDLILADPASRDHAQLEFDEKTGEWSVTDIGSKHGTRLNDIVIQPGRLYPLRPNDLLQIAHWSFRVEEAGSVAAADGPTVHTRDDTEESGSTIALVTPTARASLSQRYLTLLLQCAKAIHRAEDIESLADAVVDAVMHGTRFTNAAFIRGIQHDGTVLVIKFRGGVLGDEQAPRISRSLIHRAKAGEPVSLQRQQTMVPTAASIVELGIDEALCIPIMLGVSPAAFLYLDTRRDDTQPGRLAPEVIEFAVGIGQIAAMALANLMRLDLQKRLVGIEAEMIAAAEAQRWVLPTRAGRFGLLEYAGENRAGRQLSGDFFDLIPLDGDRLAVTIGDVAGKGVAASVLMTAAQGFLHAALRQHGDPARAVTELNGYVVPRCGDGKFLTLWAGVIDPHEAVVRYADAGHSYVAAIRYSGAHDQLTEGRDIPVGVLPGQSYANSISPFAPGDRLVAVSDGLVEQTSARTATGHREQFGMGGVLGAATSATAQNSEIEAIFHAIVAHAGSTALEDDATAIVVRHSFPCS